MNGGNVSKTLNVSRMKAIVVTGPRATDLACHRRARPNHDSSQTTIALVAPSLNRGTKSPCSNSSIGLFDAYIVVCCARFALSWIKQCEERDLVGAVGAGDSFHAAMVMTLDHEFPVRLFVDRHQPLRFRALVICGHGRAISKRWRDVQTSAIHRSFDAARIVRRSGRCMHSPMGA